MMAVNSLDWSNWEQKADQVLRVNGWDFDADRVLGAGPLLRVGVPRHAVGAVIKLVNSYYRPAGRPDRRAWPKVPFGVGHHPSPALARLLGKNETWAMGKGVEYDVLLFVEYKSGGGTTDAAQEAWLARANRVPGCAGYVAHPSRFDEFVEVCGGVYP